MREVLCDPTRAEIVCALTVTELTVTDLAQAIGRSVPSTSQHLRILRQLGVVRSRRRGRVVYNSLDDGQLAGVVRSLIRSLATAVGMTQHPPTT